MVVALVRIGWRGVDPYQLEMNGELLELGPPGLPFH